MNSELSTTQHDARSKNSTDLETQSKRLTPESPRSTQDKTTSCEESTGSIHSSSTAAEQPTKNGKSLKKLKNLKKIAPQKLMDLEAGCSQTSENSQSQETDEYDYEDPFIASEDEEEGGPPPCPDDLFEPKILYKGKWITESELLANMKKRKVSFESEPKEDARLVKKAKAVNHDKGAEGLPPPPPRLERQHAMVAPKKRKYLYQALGHFLTYPGIEGDGWDKDTVLKLLKEKIKAWGNEAKYILVAQENHAAESAGEIHFHVFVKLCTQKNVYPDTWDLEAFDQVLHGNYQSARSFKAVMKYIMKDGDYITDGDFDPDAYIRAAKGKRSYAGELVIKEGKKGLIKAVREDPSLLFDYEKLCRAQQAFSRDCASLELSYDGPREWRPFQRELLDLLDDDPDPRKCYWITDDKGGTGKSTLARYLCLEKEAILLDEGRGRDTLFGYGGQRIVLIDLPRDADQESPDLYSNIERLKNAHYYSAKYAGEMRIYKIPHVIVFANWRPNTTKLSSDRWIIWEIGAIDSSGAGGDIIEMTDGYGRKID